LWESRNQNLTATEAVEILHSGGTLTHAIAKSAIEDFSLAALSHRPDEASLLRTAITTPWDVGDTTSAARIQRSYDNLRGTVTWVEHLLKVRPDYASGIIVRNYQRCCAGADKSSIAVSWADYDYRRRCHFALELLLSSLTRDLSQREHATISEIVADWATEDNASDWVLSLWPQAKSTWQQTAIDSRSSVPPTLFADTAVPIDNLRNVSPSEQALAAFAILSATTSQTGSLRHNGLIEMQTAYPGDRSIQLIEDASDEPFSDMMARLLQLAAMAHLQTTLRKMGNGQKCSLRFFPDGPHLRPTGLGMSPGHSGDRLTNVCRFLTDLGMLQNIDNGLCPAEATS